uniref:BTB domain-containing protein n=1 Tax=Anopheles maculatus TaxID=74869 RepID=A0A182T178_9DIPT
MVDFMYYGEVNVSTEQLPQVLKTAEMLKIKGLAEMPDASAKTEDLSGVTQTIPMDISTTPTAVNITQSQSQHTGKLEKKPAKHTVILCRHLCVPERQRADDPLSFSVRVHLSVWNLSILLSPV